MGGQQHEGSGMVQMTGGGGGGGGLPVGIVTMDPGVLEIGSIIDVIESINAGGLPDVAGQPVVGGGSGPDPGGKVINIDTTAEAPQKSIQVERSRPAGPETVNVKESAARGPGSDVVVQQTAGGAQRTVSVSPGADSTVPVSSGRGASVGKDVTIQDHSPTSKGSSSVINISQGGSRSQRVSTGTSEKPSGSTTISQSGTGLVDGISIIDAARGIGSKTVQGRGSSDSIVISEIGSGSVDGISIIDAAQGTGSVGVQQGRGTSGSIAISQSGARSGDSLSIIDGAQGTGSVSVQQGRDTSGSIAISQSATGSGDSLSIVDAVQGRGSINAQGRGRAVSTSRKAPPQKTRVDGTSSSSVQSSELSILPQGDGGSLSIIEGNSARAAIASATVAARKGHGGARGGSGSGAQSSGLQIQTQTDAETISIADSHVESGTAKITSRAPSQVSIHKPASGGGVVISTGEAEDITLSDDVMSFIRILAKSGRNVRVPSKKATPKPQSKRKHRTWKPTPRPPGRPRKPPAYTPVQKQTPKPQPAAQVVHYGVSSGGYTVHKERPTYQGVHDTVSHDPLAFIRQLESLQKLMALAMMATPAPKLAHGHRPAYPSAPAEGAKVPDVYNPPAQPAYPPPASKKRPEGGGGVVAPSYKKKTFRKHGSTAAPRVYFSGSGKRPQGKARIQNAYGPPSTIEAPTVRSAYGPAVSTHPQNTVQHSAYSTPIPSYTTGHVQTSEVPRPRPIALDYYNTSQDEVYYGSAGVGGQAQVTSSTAVGPWADATVKQGANLTYGRWNSSTTAYGNTLPPKGADWHPWLPISPPVKVKVRGRKGTWKKKGRFLKIPRNPKGAKSSSTRWPDTVSGYVASESEKDEDVVPVVLHLPAEAFTRSSQENGFVRTPKWSLLIVKQNATDASQTEKVPEDAPEAPEDR